MTYLLLRQAPDSHTQQVVKVRDGRCRLAATATGLVVVLVVTVLFLDDVLGLASCSMTRIHPLPFQSSDSTPQVHPPRPTQPSPQRTSREQQAETAKRKHSLRRAVHQIELGAVVHDRRDDRVLPQVVDRLRHLLREVEARRRHDLVVHDPVRVRLRG